MKALLVVLLFIPGLAYSMPSYNKQISTDSVQRIKIKKSPEVKKKEECDYRTLLIEWDSYSPDKLFRIKIGTSFETDNISKLRSIFPYWLVSTGFGKQFKNDRIGAELGLRYWLNTNVGIIASPVLTYFYDGSIKPAIRGTLIINVLGLASPRRPSSFYLSVGIESGLWHKEIKPYNNIISSFIYPFSVPVKKKK